MNYWLAMLDYELSFSDPWVQDYFDHSTPTKRKTKEHKISAIEKAEHAFHSS